MGISKYNLRDKKNKCPGSDDIYYEMLKMLPKKNQTLYNHILNTKNFPKMEIILYSTHIIIGKGKGITNPENYRPIVFSNSLCIVLGKKIINKWIIWCLETNN